MQFEQGTTGKVDAQVIPPFGDYRTQTDENEDNRKDESAAPKTQKINCGIAKYAQFANAEAGVDLARDDGIVDVSCHKDGCEH